MPLSRSGHREFKNRSARFSGALALMLALMVAVATGHGTAWADTSAAGTQGASATHSEATSGTDTKAADDSTPDDAAKTDDPPTESDDEPSTETDTDTGLSETTDPDVDDESDEPTISDAPKGDSVKPNGAVTPTAKTTHAKTNVDETETTPKAAVGLLDKPEPSPKTEALKASRLDTEPAAKTLSTSTSLATLSTAAVETTTVTPPAPLSPIAEIVAIPGRIVNAVLRLVGVTTAAGQGPSPISPAPIADLVFAVFRRMEEALGLDKPVALPTPPTLVYDGPLDVKTPTVAQFLNAATTEYVLGGTPGGLVPFTVDGWQLSSTKILTGMTAKVWVTPENQVIIAYSGTTGGTNLLFNPLIALGQILTDVAAGFGDTTPQAFTQAVDFAEQVQAEAAAQGYAPEDIFVTGHSLGAWEAQYVAQQLGLNGIGFEGPGLPSAVPSVGDNGATSLFVNTATYGDLAAYLSSDLPGLYPFTPYPYVPAGGLHPHYGPIVMLGDPTAVYPIANSAALWGKGIIGSLIAVVDLFGNFFASHLPGVQAYNLGIDSDPGVVPWLGINRGPVNEGFGELSIPEFLKAASDAGILVAP